MKAHLQLQLLSDEIRAQLRSAGDPEYRFQIERLVPGVRTYGVRIPEIRSLVRLFGLRFPTLQLGDACSLLDRLAAGGVRDEFLFGIFWLARFSKSFDQLSWSAIRGWIEMVDNWEVCDQLAMQIAGPCVANNLALVDELVGLSTHESCWHRRVAVASTIPLNQKGRSHADETFRVLRPVIVDKEKSVRAAVTWAIREICKKNEPAAFRFLSEQAANMPSSMLREAAIKLSPVSKAALTSD